MGGQPGGHLANQGGQRLRRGRRNGGGGRRGFVVGGWSWSSSCYAGCFPGRGEAQTPTSVATNSAATPGPPPLGGHGGSAADQGGRRSHTGVGRIHLGAYSPASVAVTLVMSSAGWRRSARCSPAEGSQGAAAKRCPSRSATSDARPFDRGRPNGAPTQEQFQQRRSQTGSATGRPAVAPYLARRSPVARLRRSGSPTGRSAVGIRCGGRINRWFSEVAREHVGPSPRWSRQRVRSRRRWAGDPEVAKRPRPPAVTRMVGRFTSSCTTHPYR